MFSYLKPSEGACGLSSLLPRLSKSPVLCYNGDMDIWTELGRFSILETDRLLLRPFLYTDGDDFWEISSNPDNLPFIFPSQVNRSESDFLMVHYFMKEPLGIWAIENKSNGKMIGVIRFEHFDLAAASVEIGYFLNKQYWGQGLMTECLKTLTFFSFNQFGLKTLSIIAHLENQASQRVAQKAGFVLKRQFKGSDRYTRKMRDYVEYQLRRGKYRYE